MVLSCVKNGAGRRIKSWLISVRLATRLTHGDRNRFKEALKDELCLRPRIL